MNIQYCKIQQFPSQTIQNGERNWARHSRSWRNWCLWSYGFLPAKHLAQNNIKHEQLASLSSYHWCEARITPLNFAWFIKPENKTKEKKIRPLNIARHLKGIQLKIPYFLNSIKCYIVNFFFFLLLHVKLLLHNILNAT